MCTINAITGYSNRYREVFPTQKKVGQLSDLGREQVGRNLRSIEETMLMRTQHYRIAPDKRKEARALGHGKNAVGNTSNHYIIHPYFFIPYVREKLKHLLPALNIIPIVMFFFMVNSASQSTCVSVPFPRKSFPLLETYIKRYSYCKSDNFHLKKVNNRKEFYMSEDPGDTHAFRLSVRELGHALHLTYSGMAMISKFSDKALSTAFGRFKSMSYEIKAPVPFFISLCQDASRDTNQPVNQQESDRIARVLDISLAEDPCYEDGLKPVPGKKISPQREQVKRTRLHRKYTPAATKKVTMAIEKPFSIDQLKEINPDMVIEQIEYVKTNEVKVTHHFDTELRPTTDEEREIWKNELTERAYPDGKIIFALPTAPMEHEGPLNNPSSEVCHLEENGTLHRWSKKNTHCLRCVPNGLNVPKEEKMTPKSVNDPNRTLSAVETELVSWFRDYYRHIQKNLIEIPAWYENIVTIIKQRSPILEKHLGMIRDTLEANGWKRDSNGEFAQEITYKHADADQLYEKAQTLGPDVDSELVTITDEEFDISPDDFEEVI